MKTKILRISAVFIAIIMVLPLLSACSKKENDAESLKAVSDLTTERIGVQAGTFYEEELLKKCPDVNISYFTVPTDMYVALDQGKIDGFLMEDVSYNLRKVEFPWMRNLEGVAATTPVGAAISEKSKHPNLHAQMEEFLENIKANGISDEMETYWLHDFKPLESVVDRSGITGENGKISVAVETGYEPFSYYGFGDLQGYDIDFIYRFCREYGYEPQFFAVEYDAIPVGISTGKFDIGMSVIMSEERSENVLFAGPYLAIDIYTVIKDENMAGAAANSGLFESFKDSFEQTFIRENRWLLFLQGAGTTLFITCLSALFGTILGFILYMLCKKSSLFANVNNFISWFIGGMPTVLLLMVLYYLVFVDWADIGGVWVAIVCFTILFGYSIFEILNTSVLAIGKGQEEGARALGYSSNQAFFLVILPQALRVAFPQLKSEIVGLIKETSIVGYISIADLTRMSDIVRGRTYEAFFPLVTTTIIYFALIWLILFVVKRFEIELTHRPVRIEKIKKGIKTK